MRYWKVYKWSKPDIYLSKLNINQLDFNTDLMKARRDIFHNQCEANEFQIYLEELEWGYDLEE